MSAMDNAMIVVAGTWLRSIRYSQPSCIFRTNPLTAHDVPFRRDLVMRITEAPSGIAARFDFVLNIR